MGISIQLVAGFAAIGMVFVFANLLRSPMWVVFTVTTLVILHFVSLICIWRSEVRIGTEELMLRFGWSKRFKYRELVGWSELGSNSPVFCMTSTGKVFGFSKWCVFGHRRNQLKDILREKNVEELSGDKRITPWYLWFL